MIIYIIFYLSIFRIFYSYSLQCFKHDLCFFALSPSFNYHNYSTVTIKKFETELHAFLSAQSNSSETFLSPYKCAADSTACLFGFDFIPSFRFLNESILLSLYSSPTIIRIQSNNNLYAMVSSCKSPAKAYRRSHQLRNCLAQHQPESKCLFNDTCAFYYKYALLLS